MRTIREVLNKAAHAVLGAQGFDEGMTEDYDFSRTGDTRYIRLGWRPAVAVYEVIAGQKVPEDLDEPATLLLDSLVDEVARLRRALGQAADIIESAADVIDTSDDDIDGEGAEARDDAARFRRMSLGEPEPAEEDRAVNYDAWCKREERERAGEDDLREVNDEVCKYLDSLMWDGVPRVRALAERVAVEGAVDEAVASLAGFFEDAVRRATTPGCKADQILLVVGDQGYGKTTLMSDLVGRDFFGEGEWDGRRRRTDEAHACWVYATFTFHFTDGELKAFLSQTSDDYRPMFSKESTKHERSFLPVVFTYVMGELSSRGFRPLRLRSFAQDREAVAWVKANRDQLWAEAVAKCRVKWLEGNPEASTD